MKTKEKKQRTWKPFTAEDYKVLKELQKLDVDRTTMQRITGRGGATIHYMMVTDTFEEFQKAQKIQTERSHKRALEKKAQRETPVFDAVEQRLPLEEVEEVTSETTVVDQLVKLNATLERLVTAWEATPTEEKRKNWLR